MLVTLRFMRVNFDTSELYHRTFSIAAARMGVPLAKLFEGLADKYLSGDREIAAKALGVDPDEGQPTERSRRRSRRDVP